MTRILEFLLPAWLRARAPLREDARLAQLAAVHDTDPTLRALLEVVQEQLEEEIKTLLQNNLGLAQAKGQTRDGAVQLAVNTVVGSGQMEYHRGRAASLYWLLLRLESEREAAREEMQRRQKLASKPAGS